MQYDISKSTYYILWFMRYNDHKKLILLSIQRKNSMLDRLTIS